jgi:hypothetical protein
MRVSAFREGYALKKGRQPFSAWQTLGHKSMEFDGGPHKAPVTRPIVERLVGNPTIAALVNFAQTDDPPIRGVFR